MLLNYIIKKKRVSIIDKTKEYITAFVELFFPRNCITCGIDLFKSEKGICRKCEASLPCTYFNMVLDNPVHQIFWGRLKVEKATSLFFYRKGESLQRILKSIKYKGNVDLSVEMGRIMGRKLQKSYFFEGIDMIIPVPLHYKKFQKRGYNQSQFLAEGMSEVTGIPVETNHLYRILDTSTQTKKGRYERYENIANAFKLYDSPMISGKSILLIDDVITTGATLEALGNTILKGANDVKLSVVSLAYAY